MGFFKQIWDAMFPKPGDLERAVNSRVQELKTQGSLRGVDLHPDGSLKYGFT